MKIGVLTGGGDAPGLNAAIRGVTRRALSYGYEVVGIRRGWAGLLEKDVMKLDRDAVSGILPKGGTILGTSRTNPFANEDDKNKLLRNIEELGLDAIVAIGGDDTQGVAAKLSDLGYKVVGIPKTIDNDLSGTDRTFGFDTAVAIATEAIDRIHTTAESHQRTIVVEVMGR
ncbi:MAG: 6-phosphofructokinase, partial [TACK group archaeon]|nr:6-phosphofructokinase [TACK group archaeon]